MALAMPGEALESAQPVMPPTPKQAALAPARPSLPARAPVHRLARSIPPELRQFCSSNAAVAGAAQVAWEAAQLSELDTRLKNRIAELEAKRAEYETWLKKREEAMTKARDGVVAIYAKMPAEAAAQQLAAMDDDLAAALLAKLNSRVASAILAEMDPSRAAHLANAMLGTMNAADGKKS